MAAAEPFQPIKAEVTCPICLDLFRDPVTAECGHSFCQECIARHCEGGGDVTCPLCKGKLRKKHLQPNWELKKIVKFLRAQIVGDPRERNTCEKHQQPLQLYCKEHQTPICLVCKESQDHRGHMVAPVEEAVQEYWETMRKHLAGMESTYGRLRSLVTMDRKLLSPSAAEEMHRRLKKLTDNSTTLVKVTKKGWRQRFEALASQPQPHEPDWRGHGRGVDTGSELRECQGREPGSEPAAETQEEKQEETGSHVVRVCEEASTPKYGLDQASLDPGPHTISNTREGAEPKAGVKTLANRFDQLLSQSSVGRRKASVSSAGQGAAQTESGGDTGGGGQVSEEQKEAAACVQSHAPFPRPNRGRSSVPASQVHKQADAPSRGDSLQGQSAQSPVSPELPSDRRKTASLSPKRGVVRLPVLRGVQVTKKGRRQSGGDSGPSHGPSTARPV